MPQIAETESVERYESQSEEVSPGIYAEQGAVPEEPGRSPRLSRAQLEAMAQNRDEDAYVSIFMPVHHDGRQTRQNPIRLGNLLREAEGELRSRGLRRDRVDEILAPARRRVDDADFWRQQRGSVAILLADGGFTEIRMARGLDELVVVGDGFHLTPLVPLTEPDDFAVLAFSQQEVKLYEAVGQTLRPLPLPNTPKRLEEVVGDEPAGAHLQHRPSGVSIQGRPAPAMFHGRGAGKDDLAHEVERFIKALDKGLHQDLPDREMAVVLAGIERNVSYFRHHTHLPNVMEAYIEGDPTAFTVEELYARAWEIAEPVVHAGLRRARDEIEKLAHSSSVVRDLGEILRSAQEGRLDTLFVAEDQHRWGRFDESTREVDVHPDRQPGDEDLLERVVREALARGTAIHVTRTEQMPCREAVIANVRFERA